MAPRARIVELSAEDTHDLRRRVLRDGTATQEVELDGDHDPTTFHLGARLDTDPPSDAVVAISTWIVRRHPDHPALAGVQLRGMATSPEVRGQGIGDLLLSAGLQRVSTAGAQLVWARARDTALGFYRRRGFRIHGHGYVDLATGLPHHDVILDLGAGHTRR